MLTEMPLVGWLERSNLLRLDYGYWYTLFSREFPGIEFRASLWLANHRNDLERNDRVALSNALAELSPEGRKGSYMGMYSMSWSFSHVFGHNTGMNMADRLGFGMTFNIFGIGLLVIALICDRMHKIWKQSVTFIQSKEDA